MEATRHDSTNDSVEDECAEYGDILDAAFDAGFDAGKDYGIRKSAYWCGFEAAQEQADVEADDER